MNIGIGVMQYVVLYLPVKHRSAYQVEGITEVTVKGGIRSVSIVCRIMHHAHANTGHAKSHHRKAQKQLPGIFMYEQQGEGGAEGTINLNFRFLPPSLTPHST